jgi:serine/threonine protein kinase
MIMQRQELEHAKAEKSVLQKLVHPFLVNLNYSFQTPDKLYFVMDYINGGELFYHLQKDKRFPEDRARFYLAEIACGLEYLHSNGVIYRDLKPENLLLTGDGHICLTDFGLAKEGLLCEDARTSTFCGTPEYLAPEVLNGEEYGKAVDWWSYGTLMYEMLTGLPPFYCEDVQKMYQKIISAPLNIPSFFSPEARDLVIKFLDRDPKTRLSDPRNVRSHGFFGSIDWEKLEAKEIKPPFVPQGKDDASSTKLIDPGFLAETTQMSVVTDPTKLAELPNIAGFTYQGEAPIAH